MLKGIKLCFIACSIASMGERKLLPKIFKIVEGSTVARNVIWQTIE